MPKTVRIAAVQMDAFPAPVPERLARAAELVSRAAGAGAELVVLPEVFNTGYEYNERNYGLAETFAGPTAAWMSATAARYQIYLAGTFLRAEASDIYNTMLLVAPDGQRWHYDKSYPWAWERAYFRPGTGPAVADTPLGKIGMLICWDVAHPALWQKYAGKVQLMLVSSCPPNVFGSDFVLPDGKRLASQRLGPLVRSIKRASDPIFGEFLRRQAAALGVPFAQATSTGTFSSTLPAPKRSLAMLASLYPSLLRYHATIDQLRVETDYFNETCLVDAAGVVLKRVTPGLEGYVLDNVTLPGTPPLARGRQPSFGLPAYAYLFDALANAILAAEYRNKTRKEQA